MTLLLVNNIGSFETTSLVRICSTWCFHKRIFTGLYYFCQSWNRLCAVFDLL